MLLSKHCVYFFVLFSFFFQSSAFSEETGPDLQNLRIPYKLGKVLKVRPGTAAENIIYILDLHSHPEAQKKMAQIIEICAKTYGADFILVEGATGDANLDSLKKSAVPEIREKVAKEYLEKGLISGEEYLQLSSKRAFNIQGIEDPVIYQKNLQAYRALLRQKESLEKDFTKMADAASALNEKIYSPELTRFKNRMRSFYENKVSLLDYAKELALQSEKNGISVKRYPEMARLFRLSSMVLDSEQVSAEYNDFLKKSLEEIQQRNISKAEKEALSRKLTLLLVKELKYRSVDFKEEMDMSIHGYPEFEKYIQILGKLHSLDELRLKHEMFFLETEVLKRLAGSKESRNLLEAERGLEMAGLLLNAQLSSEGFKYIFKHAGEFQPLRWLRILKDLAGTQELPETLDWTYDAMLEWIDFYETCKSREATFDDRILALMQMYHKDLGIVIVGGFHAETLVKTFEQRGVGYVILCPVISGDFEKAGQIYQAALFEKAGGFFETRENLRSFQWMRAPATAQSPGVLDELRQSMEQAGKGGAKDSRKVQAPEALLDRLRKANGVLMAALRSGKTYKMLIDEVFQKINDMEKIEDLELRRQKAVELRKDHILFEVYALIQEIKKVYGDALIDTERVMGIVYSPFVGYVSQLIKFAPRELYNDFCMAANEEGNNVILVSDGSALLGLGNMGVRPMRSVLEGKQSLMKHFGAIKTNLLFVNTYELMLRYESAGPEERVALEKEIVAKLKKAIYKAHKKNPRAAFMMEDIAAPFCFTLEKELNAEGIPTVHDDQHGTAIVSAAAVINSLRVAGYYVPDPTNPSLVKQAGQKDLKDAKVVVYGAGASGFAVARLLKKVGVGNIIGFDSKGPLHKGLKSYQEGKLSEEKKEFAGYHDLTEWPSDPDEALKEALKGADGFIGLSSMKKRERFYGREEEFLKGMKPAAFVMPMANPTPEFQVRNIIEKLGPQIFAIATGGFGRAGAQTVNNSSAFPGLYYAIDYLAKHGLLTSKDFDLEKMEFMAAFGLANVVDDEERQRAVIIPPTFSGGTYNTKVTQAVAKAVFKAVIGKVPEELEGDRIQNDLLNSIQDLQRKVEPEIREFFELLEFPDLSRSVPEKRDDASEILWDPSRGEMEIIDLTQPGAPAIEYVKSKLAQTAAFFRSRGDESAALQIEQVIVRPIVRKGQKLGDLPRDYTYLAGRPFSWVPGKIESKEKGPVIYPPFDLLYQASLMSDETGNIEPLAELLRHEASQAHQHWQALLHQALEKTPATLSPGRVLTHLVRTYHLDRLVLPTVSAAALRLDEEDPLLDQAA